MTTRSSSNDDRELRVDRNSELRPSLLLLDVERASTDVLRPHADDVTATLAGIEQKRLPSYDNRRS